MTSDLAMLIKGLDSVRMRITADRLLQDFIARRPSESELEAAYLYFAAWCHEHVHRQPREARR
jgi:hypothetical protein